MDPKKIFKALQSGNITAEEARRRLLNGWKPENAIPTAPAADPLEEKAAPVVPSCIMTDTKQFSPPSGPIAPLGVGDIAVIGINGRFPMASDLDEFWSNLTQGTDCTSEVPRDRWDNDEYYSADKEAANKTYCKWGGFISGVDEFDPLFFNISPRDAELIDPQERKFLEVVWETLEQAGYTRKRIEDQLNGEVGVFVGAMYQQYHAFDADLPKKALIALSSCGSIANRVSYFFDLRGPSITLDTMCSSGSVAIDMACQNLRSGSCKMAIAGATNLSIHPYKYIALSQTQMLSSDKDKRSFSAGDGFIPAEVVAAVLLKPLSAAEADGDRILAVIKSTAVGHKGRSEGFSVPELDTQISLLEDHFARARIRPDSISYIECSASGSQSADAVEFTALRQVFCGTDSQFRCALGSVKGNIGHAEASAGLAQLAKVVLQLFHRKLVQSIKSNPPNPYISFDATPLYLVQSLMDWEQPVQRSGSGTVSAPRRACINTFGAGGTNCHIILEEYVVREDSELAASLLPFPPIFLFSTQTRRCLLPLVEKFRKFFERNRELSLRNVAYTLQFGREEMAHRVAIVAYSGAELIDGLQSAARLLSGDNRPPLPDNLFLSTAEGDFDPAKDQPAVEDEPGGIQDSARDHRVLAEGWVRGRAVPWYRYYHKGSARIVPLPTYIFDSKRYWVSGLGARTGDLVRAESASRQTSPSTEDESVGASHRIADFIESFLIESLAMQPDVAINWKASFIELGADSITLSRLARRIEGELGITVQNRDFLQFRTISSLSNYLTSRRQTLGAVPRRILPSP